MSTSCVTQTLSRRRFLRSMAIGGAVVAAATAVPTAAAATPQAAPARQAGTTLTIGVGGWAQNSMKSLLDKLGFTKQTGIQVQVVVRPGTPPEFLTQMTSAIQAGRTPYDVIDFEDDVAIPFSRNGWLLGLDDAVPANFWDDFPPAMSEMADIWDRYNGQTFRIHHNFEANYFWYRKDLFDAKGLSVPRTWDDLRALGPALTDFDTGLWAYEDGMAKGGFLNVALAYYTRQAGGSYFDVDDSFRTALQFMHDLMYSSNTLNPASLQKDYDQLNADYMADRVACMRQWPFFYTVSRANTQWFTDDKVVLDFPPVGPAGSHVSTYAAGWGFGIPKTTANPAAAKQLVNFLVSQQNAGPMAQIDVWYLSPRSSVLATVGDQGIAAYLKQYTDVGIISTRPFHPKYLEATNALEEVGSAYLTDQISLDDAMSQAQARMAAL